MSASFLLWWVWMMLLVAGCPASGGQVKTLGKNPATKKVAQKAPKKATKKTSKWKALAGQPAPDFSLRDLRKRRHTLRQYRGKVILLNFWATWCAPCKKEFPHFDALLKKYKKKGLVILAANGDEAGSLSQVGPMIYRYGYRFTVLLDTESRVISLYNPKRHRPFTALIDRQGQLRMTHQGYIPGDEVALEKHIQTLLNEKTS